MQQFFFILGFIFFHNVILSHQEFFDYELDLHLHVSAAQTTQADGKILKVGSYRSSMAMVRYTDKGILDDHFAQDGIVIQKIGSTSRAYAVAVQEDDKIVVAGQADDHYFIARFLPDGMLDTKTFHAPDGYVVASIGAKDCAYGLSYNRFHRSLLVTGLSDNHLFAAWYTDDGSCIQRQIDQIAHTRYERITQLVAAMYHRVSVVTKDQLYQDANDYQGYTPDTSDETDSIKIDIHDQWMETQNAYLYRTGGIGELDTSFGTGGQVQLSGISGASSLAGLTPQVVLPLSNGDYYITFTNGSLVRLTSSLALDTTFAPLNSGFAFPSYPGVFGMAHDGYGCLVLTGTDGGVGWVQRYNAGLSSLDTAFNSATSSALTSCTMATIMLQQTLGRYLIAGQHSSGNVALFACANTGNLDTTFNSNGTSGVGGGGTIPGIFNTGIAGSLYAVVADLYDRLILAYKNGSGIDIMRLTSAGQLDTTFGSSGIISAAIPLYADSATQVRLALDASGNIVLASHISNGAVEYIAVKAYQNQSGSVIAETQLNIAGLVSPTLTSLIATSDGYVLCAGMQSASNKMWVARVKDNGAGGYILDTNFNANATYGSIQGIMQFAFDMAGSVTGRALYSIALYNNQQLAMVGIEIDSANTPTTTPFLAMANDSATFITQELICQSSQQLGTNDLTLGASPSAAADQGVIFYASSTADATSSQKAQAVALQDDANILVAVDGGTYSGSGVPSDIFLKLFNIDGTPNTTFGSSGQQTILSMYQNQNVCDTITFTTPSGVHKAIIAGYVTNSALGSTSSLLMQYNLSTGSIDDSFGGFDSNPEGIAFGDGKQAFVVGQQSIGRIIVGGLSQNNEGLLLGYTSTGKLDPSFGVGGYLSTNSASTGTGQTGIYTHAIDSQNRIIIAFNNAGTIEVVRFVPDGTAVDSSFTVSANISTVTSNSNIRVAIDASNNVFVAGITGGGNTISIIKYNGTNGAQIGSTVTLSATSLGGSGSSVYGITKLLIDASGNLIFVGYDSYPTPNMILILSLTSALSFNTAFNGTGYLVYSVAAGNMQVSTDALIHPDGRIIIAGYQN